jgi:hypothetical protein
MRPKQVETMESRDKPKHTHRKLTPEEQARVDEARRLIAKDETEIRQQLREYQKARAGGPAGNSPDREVGDRPAT